jgi:putative hydrolase of the HAD superfamily
MPVQAVVFDFDGLLIDTETPEFQAWSQVFAEHGSNLSLDEWAKCVGGGDGSWTVERHLRDLVERADLVQAFERAQAIRNEALAVIRPQPGAEVLFDRLDKMAIPFGIASSSRHMWVDGFLRQMGWRERFEVVVTADMVGAKKPDPKSYLEACVRLGVDPVDAVAFEDSTNGLKAAKAAGMIAVAVPNDVTRGFDLSMADRRIESLLDADENFLNSL